MRSLWAIAKNTLSQAIRMKVAAVVIVLLLVLLPLMSVVMEGDGTLLGKLQTFVSYGLGLVSLLLCILTIAISTFTLSNDLKRKHLHLVVTKPVRRYQVVAGKLLGILILNVVLVAIFGGVIYALTLAMPTMIEADPMQVERAGIEFFAARTGLSEMYDEARLRRAAEERFETLRREGQLPRNMSQAQVFSELIAQERMIARSCPPGRTLRWTFSGVRPDAPDDPDAETYLFIRFKYQATTEPPDNKIYGMWRIGDLRQYDMGVDRLTTPVYYVERDDTLRSYHEFAVPANAVSDDGVVAVEFLNTPGMNNTTVVFDDVEVLFHSGGFTANFIRSMLIIYIRLVFLATLGVSLTTWLSFPVALLVSLVVFFVGLTNGFIQDSFGVFEQTLGILADFVLRPMLWLLPKFDGEYNPSMYIIDGRLIGWWFIFRMIGVTVLIKSTLILLLGVLIFARREIAKVVV